MALRINFTSPAPYAAAAGSLVAVSEPVLSLIEALLAAVEQLLVERQQAGQVRGRRTGAARAAPLLGALAARAGRSRRPHEGSNERLGLQDSQRAEPPAGVEDAESQALHTDHARQGQKSSAPWDKEMMKDITKS